MYTLVLELSSPTKIHVEKIRSMHAAIWLKIDRMHLVFGSKINDLENGIIMKHFPGCQEVSEVDIYD